MARIEYRHPTEDDIVSIVTVWNDSIVGLPSQIEFTDDEIRAMFFLDSDYDPEGCWLATVDGVPAGIACGFIDRARLEYGLKDSYVDLEVAHDHRGSGIEEELLKRVLEYLTGKDVSATQIPYYEADTWKRDLLEKAEFREVRRYYEMTRTDEVDPPSASFPANLEVERRMVAEDPEELASKIAQARNESFVDHFNFSPMPAPRLMNFLRAGQTTFAVTFVKDGERTVGFSMSEERHPEAVKDGVKEGWVAILGVVNSYRRQGLGRNLLLDSVGWLKSRGVERIKLLVDAENEKALGMYKSAGFEVSTVEILMVKDLAK